MNIHKTHVAYKIPVLNTDFDNALLKYAVESCGFLLPIGITSFQTWAELIKSVYSMDNPHNKYIVNFLISQR